VNVSELRARLEELERDGYGPCDVEVHLDPCDGPATPLDLATTYHVRSVEIPGYVVEGFVALYFAKAVDSDGA